MQFFTLTTAMTLTTLVSSSPLAARDMCNSTPSARNTGTVSPIATPSAATAEACQEQCEANASCQSFVFGLQSGASAPACELFAVPASQVPAQATNLVVFDKACSSVPTEAPTSENPVGTTTTTTTTTTSGSTSTTGDGGNTGSNAGSSSGSNTGPNAGSSSGSNTGSNTGSSNGAANNGQH